MKNKKYALTLLVMSIWLSLFHTGCDTGQLLFTLSHQDGSWKLISGTGAVTPIKPPLQGGCPLGKATRQGSSLLWSRVDVMPGKCPDVSVIKEVMPWRLDPDCKVSVFYAGEDSYKAVLVKNGDVTDTRIFKGFDCENFLTYLDDFYGSPVLYMGLEDGPLEITHNASSSGNPGNIRFDRLNPTLSEAPERQRILPLGVYYLGACDLNNDNLREVVITDGAGLIEVISNIHENPMLIALQDPSLLSFLNPEMIIDHMGSAAKSGSVDCLSESGGVQYASASFWHDSMSSTKFTIICDQMFRFNDAQNTPDIDLSSTSLKITTSNNQVQVFKRK